MLGPETKAWVRRTGLMPLVHDEMMVICPQGHFCLYDHDTERWVCQQCLDDQVCVLPAIREGA